MNELLKLLMITIHALQSERGCSTIYLESDEQLFVDRLADFRLASDQALERLSSAIAESDIENRALINSLSQLLQKAQESIDNIRPEVMTFQSGGHFVKTFSENVVNPIMMMVKKISYQLGDAGANTSVMADPSQIAAFNNFMAVKEVMGKERALGARMFLQPHRKLDHARIVHFLLQEQHLHEMAFQELASESMLSISRSCFQCVDDKQTDLSRLLSQLENQYDTVSTDDIDVTTWFDLMTSNIDRLLEVEMLIIDQMAKPNASKPDTVADWASLTSGDKSEITVRASLQRLPLFKNVRAEVLNSIAAEAHIVHLERGDRVISSGENLAYLNIILSGWVKTFHTNSKGDEAILQLLGRGEEVAGSAVYREIVVRYSAEMITDGAIVKIPARVMRQAVRDDNTLMTNALITLANRSQRQLQHLEQLSLLSTEERIIVFLNNLSADNILVITKDAPTIEREIVLPFSKAVVATALNMSPESLSRGFARLKEKGVIRIDGNKITLNNNYEPA